MTKMRANGLRVPKDLKNFRLTDTSKDNGFNGEPTLGVHITIRFHNGYKGGTGDTIKEALENMLVRPGQHLTPDNAAKIKNLLALLRK